MRISANVSASANFPQTIGAVAKTFGVTPSLIRQYELLGVVKPARDSIGRRLFLEPDIEAIRRYREKRGRK